MARLARGEYLDPLTIQIVHTVTRCVRRAFLCGDDPQTGQSFEHRREWIRARMEFLSSIFGIDCLTFAVMSNHLHVILRSRPDIVRSWSDDEVARRWLKLCPPRFGEVANEADLAILLSDPQQIAKLRVRLSDISWWMRLLSQPIARRANREDGCTGRFWEGRYRAQLLLDEAAILACAMYVDLNPIRAAMAQSLEESEFTGAKARIDYLKQATPKTKSKKPFCRAKRKPSRRWERGKTRKHSGWLSPIEIDERQDPIGTDPSPCGRRASLKGFLAIPLATYLELLDWTGRQLKHGKRGMIPKHIAPVLSKLGIANDRWMDLAIHFGSLFKRAVGSIVSLSLESSRHGKRWLQAPGSSCFL